MDLYIYQSNIKKVDTKTIKMRLLGIASWGQDKGGDGAGITISKGLKMIERKNLVEDKVEAVWCNMGLIARKPVFGVSDKARLKPVSSATETG